MIAHPRFLNVAKVYPTEHVETIFFLHWSKIANRVKMTEIPLFRIYEVIMTSFLKQIL